MLVRACTGLRLLALKERVSIATALYLAALMVDKCTMPTGNVAENASRFWLYLRRNAMIKRRGWSRHSDWTDTFYQWLSDNSKSIDGAEMAIRHLMANDCWRFRTDNEYMSLFRVKRT